MNIAIQFWWENGFRSQYSHVDSFIPYWIQFNLYVTMSAVGSNFTAFGVVIFSESIVCIFYYHGELLKRSGSILGRFKFIVKFLTLTFLKQWCLTTCKSISSVRRDEIEKKEWKMFVCGFIQIYLWAVNLIT